MHSCSICVCRSTHAKVCLVLLIYDFIWTVFQLARSQYFQLRNILKCFAKCRIALVEFVGRLSSEQ